MFSVRCMLAGHKITQISKMRMLGNTKGKMSRITRKGLILVHSMEAVF